MHEVAHVLGFDATSFTLFRDSLGNPRTPRDPTRSNIVAAAYQKTVTCTMEGALLGRTLSLLAHTGTRTYTLTRTHRRKHTHTAFHAKAPLPLPISPAHPHTVSVSGWRCAHEAQTLPSVCALRLWCPCRHLQYQHRLRGSEHHGGHQHNLEGLSVQRAGQLLQLPPHYGHPRGVQRRCAALCLPLPGALTPSGLVMVAN